MDNEKELHVRGPAQNALLDEFRLSLTRAQSSDLYTKVRDENPDANSTELAKNLRAVMLTAALEDRRKKIQDEKDSSFPPPLSAGSASKAVISPADKRNKDGSLSILPLGAFKPASPLSLQAQSKSDASLRANPFSLSLTKEERAPVFAATKLANPDADRKAFNLAYGIALWKADSQKRGINPGSNLDAADISFSSETDDKDNSGEDSDSSEDGMQVIRNDLLRQRQVSPPSSPKENQFLAGLMKSPAKLQLDE